jgi:cytochrome oxidase Cu insertion factor (SCO1/SenC/PrrC family)
MIATILWAMMGAFGNKIRNTYMRYWWLLIVAFMLGLAGLGLVKKQYIQSPRKSELAAKSAIGGEFFLTNQLGQRVHSYDFRGKIMMVYFGYTFCPDICPMSLHTIDNALTLLGKDAEKLQPIFITIDPERDTVSLLKDYMENYNKHWVALTGTTTEIAGVVRAYKVYAAKAPQTNPALPYLVDHSSFIYIIDQQGDYQTHFHLHSTPEEIVAAIRKLL